MSRMAKHKWRLVFGCAAALLALGTPTVSPASDFKPAACVDTTPHKIRMVRVAPGVELQVLDWGGKGPAMVLLTGGGDNAHVYDDFAFQFTDYFHVYRHHPPRLSALEPAAGRLRRPDPGQGRHRGARCPGHREGGVRRAFGRGHRS